MSTSREACSGWGGVELSFLGATFHVSTHAPSTCTDIPTPRAGPGQLPRVRGRTPGAAPAGCPTQVGPGVRATPLATRLRPPRGPFSLDLWHFIAGSPSGAGDAEFAGADGGSARVSSSRSSSRIRQLVRGWPCDRRARRG